MRHEEFAITDDTLPPELKSLIRKACRAAHRKGFAAGRAEVMGGLKAVAELNGSAAGVFRRSFKEEDHPRDAGKFAEKPGASGGEEKPEPGGKEEKKPTATNRKARKAAAEAVESLTERIEDAGGALTTQDHTNFTEYLAKRPPDVRAEIARQLGLSSHDPAEMASDLSPDKPAHDRLLHKVEADTDDVAETLDGMMSDRGYTYSDQDKKNVAELLGKQRPAVLRGIASYYGVPAGEPEAVASAILALKPNEPDGNLVDRRELGTTTEPPPSTPQPEPGAPPATSTATTEHHEIAARWVSGSGLAPALKEKYTKDTAEVLTKMPEPARKLAVEALEKGGGTKYYADTREVTAVCSGITGRRERSIGGFVDHFEGEDTATMHVDGGSETDPKWPDKAQEVYAHELWHATDVGHRFTSDPKWQAVWASEIQGGPHLVSQYAKKSAVEGWAELGRVITLHGAERCRVFWPGCIAHLEEKGLLSPTVESKSFREDEHPRDAGKFAEKEGAGAEAKAGKGQEPATDKPAPAQPQSAASPPTPEQLGTLHKELAAKMPEIEPDGPEWEALGDYVTGGFVYLNESLRSGQPAKRGAANIPVIQKAIESAPVLDKPVTAYRGVRFPTPEAASEFVAKLKGASERGELLEEPGFMSTSINPAVGQKFGTPPPGGGAVLFEVSARQGLYVGDTVGGKVEMEYVLKHGSRFHIKGVSDRNGQQVVHLEQVL